MNAKEIEENEFNILISEEKVVKRIYLIKLENRCSGKRCFLERETGEKTWKVKSINIRGERVIFRGLKSKALHFGINYLK